MRIAWETQIQEEIADIKERRINFEKSVRRVIEILIADPDVLAEPIKPKLSDVREQLLSLAKRQALVRIGGDMNLKPQIFTMKTADVPQAVKQEEAKRRQYQLRQQTRAIYCQHRSQVEQYFHDKIVEDDEPPDAWYEE